MEQIKFVELNNKSRKGLYVYVKGTGKRGAYYKYRKESTLDAYKEYYNRRDKKERIETYLTEFKHREKRRKVRTALSGKTDRYIKKIKKRGTISKVIKGGIVGITISNVQKITKREIFEKTKKMLEPLVLDKEILELIAKEENMQKIKHRLEYRITISDGKGKKIEASLFNKTPMQALLKLKEVFGEGKTVDYPERALKELGWIPSGKSEKITVKYVACTIIFRKEK